MHLLTSRHAIAAALARGASGRLLIVNRARHADLIASASRAGVPIADISPRELARLAGPKARGAVLELHASDNSAGTVVALDEWLASAQSGLILALDHITDPHNLGAILRSAHLFGAGLILIPTRRSATGGDVVDRASAGASRLVTTAVVTNLRSALARCRDAGWWVYGADAGGTPVDHVSFPDRTVLVLGAEGAGVSQGVRAMVDEVVGIPTVARGTSVDSLNVSVAAGVLLYQWSLSAGHKT